MSTHDALPPAVTGGASRRAADSGPDRSATRSFLFTDIEGSTRQWEERPAMQAQVDDHFAVLRHAVAAQDGEIFATMGDGIAAAFPSAASAVAAAIAAQEDMKTVGLRVRMGIHTGEVSRRDGNYFGRAVNRAARVMSVGQGGQVLLSDLTANLISHGPNPVAVADLGSHRLRGLGQVERIWQVVEPGDAPGIDARPSADAGQRRSVRSAAVTHGSGPTGAFIGRSAALATFDDVLARARSGASATLLVSGEAGVGKTRLVTEWSRRAHARDAVVLSGSCVQLHSAGVPYAPLVEALRRLADEQGVDRVRRLLGAGHHAVARLLPELDPAAATGRVDPWGQGQLFEAVLELVCGFGADVAVVLVIEDLHWADLATLDLLNFLVRNLAGRGVVIVGTMRTELEPEHPLRLWATELARLDGVERMSLARFGRAEVFQLLTESDGSLPDPAVAEEIFRRSGGNAFFAQELRHAADHGDVLPSTLVDTLLARVAALRPATQRVLRFVAAAGGRVLHDLLAEVSGIDATALLACVDEAVAAHVLVIDGEGYAFRHAAFTEAIGDAVVPAERRRIHTLFGEVLARRPELGGPAARARHWMAVGDPERALPATVEAATAADGQHAPAEAQRCWEQALDLWSALPRPPSDASFDQVELLDRAAEAANRSGAFDRALERVDAALAAVEVDHLPHRAAHLNQRRGWYLSRSGRDDEALVAYDRALDLLAADPASSEHSRTLAAKGRLLARLGDAVAARRCCEEALAGAVGASAGTEEGYARHALGLALAADGEVDAAFDQLARAGQLAGATGDVVEVGWACTDLQQVAGRAGRRQEAVDVVLQIARQAHDAGLGRTYGGLLDCIAAGGLVELGKWTEADQMTQAVAARGPNGIEAIALDVVRGTLDVGRGRFTQAAEHLRAAQGFTLWLRDGRLGGLISDGLAELARWTGRFDEAQAAVVVGLARVENTGDDEMLARLCLTGVRIAADRRLAGGQHSRRGVGSDAEDDELLERLRSLARSVERPGRPWGEIQAASCTAESEARRGSGSPSVEGWELAVTAWEGLSMPYPEAGARLRLAEALLAAGRKSEGEQELLRAHAAAVVLGADPLRRSTEALARRAHVPISANDPSPQRARADPLGLTKREREVLAVLARGRTNRQIAAELFISEKTVSIHVSRILAALGVSSRGEAAAVAHRQGLAVER